MSLFVFKNYIQSNNNIRIIINIFFYLYALFFLTIIRLISSFYKIRFYSVNSSRLGHFSVNIEIFLNKIREEKKNSKIICFLEVINGKVIVCNKALLEIWKDKLTILPSILIYPIYKLINLTKYKDKYIFHLENSDRDINQYFDNRKPFIKFTERDLNRGEKLLQSVGIPNNADFVCLNIREGNYLKNHIPDYDFNYHDYRNIKIDNFVKAIKFLNEKKIYVIRVGRHIKKPVNYRNKLFIDLYNYKITDDFFDIYMAYKCMFCFGVSSGFDGLANIFRKNLGLIQVPVGDLRTQSFRHTFITKHHFCEKNKKNLSLSEIFEKNLAYAYKSEIYKEKNIKLVDNSEEEIKDLVKEVYQRVKNNFFISKNDEINQINFWKEYRNNIEMLNIKHNHLFKGQMSSKFIIKNLIK